MTDSDLSNFYAYGQSTTLYYRGKRKAVKGGDRRRRRRRQSKADLAEKLRKEIDSPMPKLNTKVTEGADDIALNVPYEIVNVEDVKTDVQQLSGLRVELVSNKGDVGNVMLWQRPVTGPTSKLGVFITNLGDNTDKWLHKWIIFREWEARKRAFDITEPPAPHKKATTKGK